MSETLEKLLDLKNSNAMKLDEKKKIKMKASDRVLSTIRKKGFNLTELEGVVKEKGTQLIISCAGSGKTTAIEFKIAYDIAKGTSTKVVDINGSSLRVLDSIWVSTFLNTGALELKSKCRKWMREFEMSDVCDSIEFGTLHAEFKRALLSLGLATNIISKSENNKLLKDTLREYAICGSGGSSINSEQFRCLQSALEFSRGMLDSSRYSCETYVNLGISPTILDGILSSWKKKRNDKGLYDFGDLQDILYAECCVKKNDEVIQFIRNRYSYIYIDEFQDVSQVQYAILKIYFSGAKKVVAIGDDDQSIYSWRGCDSNIMTKKFIADFNPVLSRLTMNYRCPKNILQAIVPSISLNENRFEKDIKAFNEGGVLRYGTYTTYHNMINDLGKMILSDIENGRSVAVLCRTNSDGLMPALLLDRINKFSYSISSEGMTLNSYIGTLVISIVKLFTERYSLAVRNALSLLVYEKFCVNNIIKICKNNSISFWDISDEDLLYSASNIYEKIVVWKKWRREKGDIEALKLVLNDYRQNVFVKKTQFNQVCKTVILSFIALLEGYNYDSVESFLAEIDDLNDRLQGRQKKSGYGTKVSIATVHEYKGKEADSVYIWNDSKGVFPCAVAGEVKDSDIEEERRIHYIANTRAREISTILSLRGMQGDFVKEMNLEECVRIGTGVNLVDGLPVEELSLLEVPEEIKNRNSFEKSSVEDYNEFWETDDISLADIYK